MVMLTIHRPRDSLAHQGGAPLSIAGAEGVDVQ